MVTDGRADIGRDGFDRVQLHRGGFKQGTGFGHGVGMKRGQVSEAGHGLGLAIVSRIIEKLGGQVDVESQADQGSLFFFTLPAEPADKAQTTSRPNRSAENLS
jgi:hypothetical protein